MFFVLGFLPCFIVAWALKQLGILRIPCEVELAGLDHEILGEEQSQINELIEAERTAVNI